MPAFDTASGIPTAQVSFRSRTGVSGWSGNTAILAELGTLQVEFRHLAYHTKNLKYVQNTKKCENCTLMIPFYFS